MDLIANFSTPLHFLCVEDDSDFLDLVIQVSEPFNIIIHSAETVKEAGAKLIELPSFDAYIIDLYLPDGLGIELIPKIRAKSGKASPIAFFTGYAHDEQLLNELKRQQVDYLIEKPVSEGELKNLLAVISEQQRNILKALHPYDKVYSLKNKYDKTIPEKIATLQNLTRSFELFGDIQHLTELKNYVHKVAGSAGSYGYHEVSAICKNVEEQLHNFISSKRPVEHDFFISINNMIRKIISHFEIKGMQSPLTYSPGSLSTLSVYLVDSDKAFLEEVRKQNEISHIADIELEHNPSVALNKLKLPDFCPKILICSQSFSNSYITADDIIATTKNKVRAPLIGMIMKNDDMTSRLSAVNQGVNLFFRHPVPTHFLLQSIAELLDIEHLNGLKALICDDDSEVTAFVAATLKEIGIETQILNEPSSLLHVLNTFRPQLLLLDILFPKFNGLHLLKSLRADPSYDDVIIIIITALHDPNIRLEAYEGKADDIFTKPLDKWSLQKRILNIVKRSAGLKTSVPSHRFQGYQELLEKLREEIKNSSTTPSHLALLEIDPFSSESHESSYSWLCASMANLLEEPGSSTSLFSMRDFISAIIFENCSAVESEGKITALLDQLSKLGHNRYQNLILNCSLVSTIGFENVFELMNRAEQGLNEARHKKEAAPFRLVTFSHQEKASTAFTPPPAVEKKPVANNEIVLIDHDVELTKLIKSAFDFHDLKVKVYHDGETALKELLEKKEKELPRVIIAERYLPDMDGIDILRQLKNHFSTIPLFYFMTIFSSDKDVSEGLSVGATDYISKPINLTLFIQKILKSLQLQNAQI